MDWAWAVAEARISGERSMPVMRPWGMSSASETVKVPGPAPTSRRWRFGFSSAFF